MRHFLKLRLRRMNAQLAEAGRHMNRAEEILHQLDAAQSRRIIGKRGINAHDVTGKADETRHAVLIDITRPASPDCRQTRAVRNVEHAAHLMLEAMGSKVASVMSASGQAVVRKAARPHDLSACVVVLRVVAQNLRLLHHRAHQRFGDAVRDFHGVALHKIALQRVHQNIRAAACRLVIRQGHGQFGVHDGELRAADVVVIAALDAAFFLGDDGGVAHLASGSGDGQDDADRQAAGGAARVVIQRPDIAVHAHAVADRLCRVNDASAADGKDEIDAFLAAKLDALIDEGQMRIRHDAAELNMRNACRVQRRLNLIEQTAAACALSAVMDQNLLAALSADKLTDLILRSTAKIDVSRGIVTEIAHFKYSPLKMIRFDSVRKKKRPSVWKTESCSGAR